MCVCVCVCVCVCACAKDRATYTDAMRVFNCVTSATFTNTERKTILNQLSDYFLIGFVFQVRHEPVSCQITTIYWGQTLPFSRQRHQKRERAKE